MRRHRPLLSRDRRRHRGAGWPAGRAGAGTHGRHPEVREERAGRRAGGPSERRRRRAAAGGGDGATSSSGHGARLGSSSSSLAPISLRHCAPPPRQTPLLPRPPAPNSGRRWWNSRQHRAVAAAAPGNGGGGGRLGARSSDGGAHGRPRACVARVRIWWARARAASTSVPIQLGRQRTAHGSGCGGLRAATGAPPLHLEFSCTAGELEAPRHSTARPASWRRRSTGTAPWRQPATAEEQRREEERIRGNLVISDGRARLPATSQNHCHVIAIPVWF